MKYNFKVMSLIIALFFIAQLIGLFVINNYLSKDLPYNIERPQFEEATSYIPITLMILVATGIAILLIKFKANNLWKIWFFIGITIALLIAFSTFIPEIYALILALVLAFIKIFKPNYIIHNLSEIFMYGGLAAIFVPILSLQSIIILLFIISIYDIIAVWKTKHMIKLAKYQSKMKIFAGLLIPYSKDKMAILGGGDIGFPLFFAGTIMKTYSIFNALIVIVFTTIALSLLLYYAQKNKFYPAMPFLTTGCIIGFLISLII
ncbi:MAG: presenilin family intramembrane aspartyl protease [Candidatus Nanoarchaeia archaeon]|nr:presenilin family intramembrane aspartyl protease [Candidatus Nanoarchaeia archaeon]